MIGRVLGKRYEIISQLGGGGMAIVYKGRDTLLNRRVTVKVLRSEFTSDEEFVARFRKEAQAVAKLSHPNIVSVYDVGQEDDIHYIVMEFIEGKNLKEIIKEQGILPLKQAVDIARQICEALEDAHENGIIHRDIKPHNILVNETGRVKVTDFGIAQIMTSVTITKSDIIMGSVHYFSPEQARGGLVGAKSDIYSAGVVLYEMVTGRVPFEGETPISVALKHIQSDPVPPSRLNPKVSADLERVIMRAMQRDLTMRYKSARDMAQNLRAMLNGGRDGDTRIMSGDEFATQVMRGPLIRGEDDDRFGGEHVARRKKKKIKPLAVLLIVAVILGLLAGAAYYAVYNFVNVPEVKVPEVVNMHVDDAKDMLGQDLIPELKPIFDSEVKKNYVIRQDPEGGDWARRDTVVTLWVSKGPELITVPNVIKKEAVAAKLALENEDFVAEPIEEYTKDQPAGIVVSQYPEGETTAPRGSKVKIVISRGPEPQYIPVPNLISLTLEQARNTLKANKLQLDENNIVEQESNEYGAGIVIAQDPMPGNNQIKEGETVKVTISKGPGPQIKTARVNVELPGDGQTHTVKIVRTDASGTKTVYGPATHQSGESFTKSVTFLNQGKIQVYIDDIIVKDEPVF